MEHQSHRGFILVLCSILMTLLVTFLAFSIDLAKAYYERRNLQIAADAASLAASNMLGPTINYSTILATITSVANANAVTAAEVTHVQPRCGVWDSNTFVPQSANVCDRASTAVEVTIHRSVAASFGRIVGINDIKISARSVSYKPLYERGNCIRPFGIEESFLSSLRMSEGSTFTVGGTQESGNWGKIDLNGNSSSGQAYTDLMLSSLCDEAIAAGSWVSVGTGNAQIWQVFDTLLRDATPPFAWQNMIFAVTTDFPNGNGLVQLLRFIRVDLVSQRGSGQNWAATFRIIDLETDPETKNPPIRKLME